MATIIGNSSKNKLVGTNNDDLILGLGGNDKLKGGAGNDTLRGGTGNDKIDGGAGIDLIDLSDATGGINFTLVQSKSNTTVKLSAAGLGTDKFKNIEGVIGTHFDDTLNGSSKDDTIYGGTGNDWINAGKGNDFVDGGGGNDSLIGGLGADQLTGGSGQDHFIYLLATDSPVAAGWDCIFDFTQGQDKIDLAAFRNIPPDLDLIWRGEDPGVAGPWEVWYHNDTTSTFVFADTSGDGAADLKIELKNTPGLDLVVTDFIGVADGQVTDVNDAPVLTGDLTATVDEGASYPITTTDLNFTDPDDNAAGVTFTVTDHVNGKVQVDGIDATSFTGTQLAANQVTFLHDGSETLSASFKVSVEDGNEDASTPVASTFNFTVNPVNDAPTSTNDSVLTNEDTTVVLTLDDFGTFADADGGGLAAVKITTLESNGSLEYDTSGIGTWVAVTPNQEISAADITAGRLRFVPDADENGTPYTTVGFQVGDGTDFSASGYTLTLNVTAVNDAPVLQHENAGTLTDTAAFDLFSNVLGQLDADDADSDDSPATLAYALDAGEDGLGTYGTLVVNPDGSYTYNPDDAAINALTALDTVTDTFAVRATDSHGAFATELLSLSLNGANDAAILSSDTQNLTETDSPADISASGTLTIGDVDSPATFNAQADTAGSYGKFSVGAGGAWTYTADSAHNEFVEGTTYTDAFDVTSADGTHTSVTVNILGTNDAPVLTVPTTVPTLDIVTANEGSDNVGVLAGDGAGGFAPAVTFATGGSNPRSVALGDVNGDGFFDIVAANINSSSISVLAGNGAGGFAPALTFGTGGFFPSSVALGDVNGDRVLDIVAANQGSNNVGVLAGAGAGRFSPALTFGTGGSVPNSVALGDVNGDGTLDIVTANFFGGNVGVLANDGAGGFKPALTFATGGLDPFSVALGDVTGDGFLDIVAANLSSKNVGVLAGDGAGGFKPALTFATGGSEPISVALGDVNGDGVLDIVAANILTDNIGVLAGDGAGGFKPALTFATGGSEPISVALGDVNGDGVLDIVAANFSSNNVGVLANDGAGGFKPALTFATGGSSPVSVALGNVADAASLSYTENQAATAINGALLVMDVDSATLSGATVSIAGNFHAAEDVLGFSFIDTASITGSYNAASGVLTLSGTDTLAAYQAALRSVTYFNSSEDPSADTRTVSYQVDDGAAADHASNLATATVSVTPVSDADFIL